MGMGTDGMAWDGDGCDGDKLVGMGWVWGEQVVPVQLSTLNNILSNRVIDKWQNNYGPVSRPKYGIMNTYCNLALHNCSDRNTV